MGLIPEDILDAYKRPVTPPQKKTSGIGGDETVPKVLDDEFAKLGYPAAARLSIVADTGRENSWDRNTIFQGHVDPASYTKGRGRIDNRGIISWNGDRVANLNRFLQQQGVYGKGDDDELRGMVRFMDHELRSKYPDAYARLRNAQTTSEASKALYHYIKYARGINPKTGRPWNIDDDEFEVKANRKWGERARALGLGAPSEKIASIDDVAALYGGAASTTAPATAPTTAPQTIDDIAAMYSQPVGPPLTDATMFAGTSPLAPTLPNGQPRPVASNGQPMMSPDDIGKTPPTSDDSLIYGQTSEQLANLSNTTEPPTDVPPHKATVPPIAQQLDPAYQEQKPETGQTSSPAVGTPQATPAVQEQPEMADAPTAEATDADFNTANEYLKGVGQPELTREQFDAAQKTVGKSAQATEYKTEAQVPKAGRTIQTVTQKGKVISTPSKTVPSAPGAEPKPSEAYAFEIGLADKPASQTYTEWVEGKMASGLAEKLGVEYGTVQRALKRFNKARIGNSANQADEDYYSALAKQGDANRVQIGSDVVNAIRQQATADKENTAKLDASRAKLSEQNPDLDLSPEMFEIMAAQDAGLLGKNEGDKKLLQARNDYIDWLTAKGYAEESAVKKAFGIKDDKPLDAATWALYRNPIANLLGFGKPNTAHVKDNIRKSILDDIKTYGSLSEATKAAKKQADEKAFSKGIGQPSEFVKKFPQYLAKLASTAMETGAIAADMNPIDMGYELLTGKETGVKDTLMKAAKDWREYVDKDPVIGTNPAYSKDTVVKFGDVAAQLATQMISAPFTGGASVLLPLAEGATAQFRTADEAGASRPIRILASTVGAALATPDVLLHAKYLKNLDLPFIDKLTKGLFSKLSKQLGEEEARQLTRVTIGSFVKTLVKNGAVNMPIEAQQERWEDVGNKTLAKLTYKPETTWEDVFVPTSEEQETYALAGLAGFGGAGVETTVEAMSDAELQKGETELARLLANRRISETDHKIAENALKKEIAARIKRGVYFAKDAEIQATKDVKTSEPADLQLSKETQRRSAPETETDGDDALQLSKDTTSTKPEETVHEFSSTQVNLPKAVSKEVIDTGNTLIPESELYTDPEDPSYGREETPHITVKYGLHTDKADDVRAILQNERPFAAKLGKISIFAGKGDTPYDVVKADVESPELHRLNKLIAAGTKVTDTFPDYKPHVTLAYVKKGEGEKYVGNTDLEGKEITFDAITFSSKNGEMVDVPLGGDLLSNKEASQTSASEAKTEPETGLQLNKTGTSNEDEKQATAIKVGDKVTNGVRDGIVKEIVADKKYGDYAVVTTANGEEQFSVAALESVKTDLKIAENVATAPDIKPKIRSMFKAKPKTVDSRDIVKPDERPERTIRTEAGPELRESRQPKGRAHQGAETAVSIPDSREGYKARYELRELEDVIPSHNPQNFQPNADYFFKNDRHYDKEQQYQEQVRSRSKSDTFDPSQLINNNPTSETGPPIIDADGNVLGGNSRSMILHRIYGDANDNTSNTAATSYRQKLEKEAKIYGIKPRHVSEFKQPVLVRVIDDESIDAQAAITELNKTSTTALTAAEQSVAESRRMSEEALDYVSGKMEAAGNDATLNQTLDLHGPDIVNRLISDGIFAGGERNKLVADGKITADGKQRIERILTGQVFDDLEQLKFAPPYVKRNIERAIAPLVKTQADAEWNIIPETREAIDLLTEFKGKGKDQTLEQFASSASLVKSDWSKASIAIAKILQQGPNAVGRAFKTYAGEYANTKSGGGLFGASTQKQAFDAAFNESDELRMAVKSRDPLDMVYNDRGEIDYEKLSTIADGIESGSIQIRRIDQTGFREEASRSRIHAEASVVVGATEKASPSYPKSDEELGGAFLTTIPWDAHKKRVEPQEKALEEYAKHRGIWFEPDTFDKKLQIGRGMEAVVYRNTNNPDTVTKVIGYDNVKRTSPQQFLDRVAIFNQLFPDTRYEITGFTRDKDGYFQFVVSQPYIAHGEDLTEAQIARWMKETLQAFPERMPVGTVRGYANLLYNIADTHGGNVIKGVDDQIYVIDAIPFLNEETGSYEPFGLTNVDAKDDLQMAVKTSDLGFYSGLEKLIADKMPERASAEQVRGIIKDAKQDELKWLDIDDFLKQKADFTKQEVLAYVSANNLQIEVREVDTRFPDLQTKGESTNARDIFLTAPNVSETWSDGHKEYSDIDNPVMRLRVNDRANENGGRDLMVDEIQPAKTAEFEKMPAVLQQNAYKLGVKYALKIAAEGGYDNVLWTTGEQQQSRSNLASGVSELSYRKAGLDGDKFAVKALDADRRLLVDAVIDEPMLERQFGKTVADKIIDGATERPRILQQDDLQSGKGLPTLYDQYVKHLFNRQARRFGKKSDMAAVGDNEAVHRIAVDPAMSNQPLFKTPTAETAAELQKYADIAEFEDEHLAQINPKVKGDTIIPDMISHELMRSAKAMLAGKDRSEVGLSLGYPLAPKEVVALIEFFQNAGDVAEEDGLNRTGLDIIVKALKKASKQDGHVAWGLPEGVQHEKTHVADARGATDAAGAIKSFEKRYDGATEWLRVDPDFQQFHTALNELQGATTHGATMAEALAWLGNGNHEEFGLSEAQAVNILAKLVDGYVRENGVESLKYFDQDNLLYEIIDDTRRQSESRQQRDASSIEGGGERQTGPDAAQGELNEDGQKERRPAYAEKHLDTKDVKYTVEPVAVTKAKGEAILRGLSVLDVLDQVRRATANLPAQMSVIYEEQKRLNDLASQFKKDGKDAEYSATIKELTALSADIITAQLQSGRSVNIAKTLEPLSGANALNVALRLKRRFSGNENAELTDGEAKAFQAVGAENTALSEGLIAAKVEVEKLRKRIEELESDTYRFNRFVPRKNNLPAVQKAVNAKFAKDYAADIASIKAAMETPLAMAVTAKRPKIAEDIKPKVAEVGAKILNDGLQEEYNETKFREDLIKVFGDDFKPYLPEAIGLAYDHLQTVRDDVKHARLVEAYKQEGFSPEAAERQATADIDAMKVRRKERSRDTNSIRKIANAYKRNAALEGNLEDLTDDPNIVYAGMVLGTEKNLSINTLMRRLHDELGLTPDAARAAARQARNALDKIKEQRAVAIAEAKGKLPEALEKERQLRREQSGVTRKMNDMLRKITDQKNLMQRFNNDVRAKLVLNYGTQLFNVVQALVTSMPMEIATDAIDSVIRYGRKSIGKQNELDEIAPQIGLTTFLLPYAYLKGNNRQVAEGILAEFPEEYFRLELGILPDVILEGTDTTSKNALLALAHRHYDRMDRLNDWLAKVTLAKYQEAYFRSAQFLATLDQMARNNGSDLKTVLDNNRAREFFTDAQVANAVDKALRVTFASQIDDPIGRTLKRAYDQTDKVLPVLLNPVTYARFTYTVAHAVVNAHTFGALDSTYLGGNGWNSRSFAKGMVGAISIGLGYAMLVAFGGDDDKWYTMYFNGPDKPPMDVRRFFPLSAFVFTAHVIQRLQEGRGMPPADDFLAGYASLEIDQYNRSAGLEFVKALYKYSSEVATGTLTNEAKLEVNRASGKMLGYAMGAHLRFFEPFRKIFAQVNADERKLRKYDKTGIDELVGELAKKLPLGQLYGAEVKKNPVTGAELEEIFPTGRLIGLNYTHPMFTSPKPTVAEEKAKKMFTVTYSEKDWTPEMSEAYTIRKEIKEAMRRKEITEAEIPALVDKYVKEGKLSEKSGAILKKDALLTNLQETLKRGFSFGEKADVASLRRLLPYMTDQENADARVILNKKDGITTEFAAEFGLNLPKKLVIDNTIDELQKVPKGLRDEAVEKRIQELVQSGSIEQKDVPKIRSAVAQDKSSTLRQLDEADGDKYVQIFEEAMKNATPEEKDKLIMRTRRKRSDAQSPENKAKYKAALDRVYQQ